MLYTEGAQYLAEQSGAYWLLDAIVIPQAHVRAVAAEEFQVWTLKVNPDSTALLTCDDGHGRVVYEHKVASLTLSWRQKPPIGVPLSACRMA